MKFAHVRQHERKVKAAARVADRVERKLSQHYDWHDARRRWDRAQRVWVEV